MSMLGSSDFWSRAASTWRGCHLRRRGAVREPPASHRPPELRNHSQSLNEPRSQSMRSSVALLAFTACVASAPPKPVQTPTSAPAQAPPPIAKKDPKVEQLHGDTRIDDYFW